MNNPFKERIDQGRYSYPGELEELSMRSVDWDKGYQEGLAEAESKVKEREQEIVEWLLKAEFSDAAGWVEGRRPTKTLEKRLSEYLSERGQGG